MSARRTPPSGFVRREGARPLVLGHRGARHAAPENTLRAFELARAEGADGVELDIRLSADQQIVVAHDRSLARVSGGRSSGEIEQLSSAELARIDVGEDERVPLLADVLDWAVRYDLVVNVEVKADLLLKRELLSRLVTLLRGRRELAERVLISSFHPGFVLQLSRDLPDFGLAWLVHEKQRGKRLLPAFRRLGAVGVNPEHTLLSAAFVREYRTAGALISTWTVNEPILAAAYAVFGVHAIISDCPGKILGALSAAPSS